MKILYGLLHNNIDITEVCLSTLNNNNIITIPPWDCIRADLFTDPLFGTLKKIIILTHDNGLVEYEDNLTIKINITDNSIHTTPVMSNEELNNKISNIHSKLKINHGSFHEELPEQKIAVRYLTGNEKVLEIGGNIGRNSLIIGYILNEQNNNNFVTLESDVKIAEQLRENRDLNNYHFHIENSAL
jgi:hypothetical protein